MKPRSFMFIAGEASGDALAAELVQALRIGVLARDDRTTADVQPLHTALAPRFFGTGGSKLAAAGVELAFDMTQHAVIGLGEVLKNYLKFRWLFNQLLSLAIERQPDVIVCVDFSGFNRRFALAVRQHVRRHRGPFNNWNPKIVQYVSPQVWASRPGRVREMASAYDLVLSIFPFEPAWYAARAPKLRVEFVGHPIVDRYANAECGVRSVESEKALPPLIALLPGSRAGELRRHLPVVLGAWVRIRQAQSTARAVMVLPNDELLQFARGVAGSSAEQGLTMQIGGLAEALSKATLALASTGTVTMECAYFRVPTVALYKTSWSTYQIGKRIVQVKHLAMPNLLAKTEVFPEFIQDAATPENLASAALSLLNDPARRGEVREQLSRIIGALGEPGANRRAASAILSLV